MMKRTKFPKKKERMINYFDKGQAQRWGRVIKETEKMITVITALDEKARVPKDKIIEERWVYT